MGVGKNFFVERVCRRWDGLWWAPCPRGCPRDAWTWLEGVCVSGGTHWVGLVLGLVALKVSSNLYLPVSVRPRSQRVLGRRLVPSTPLF